MNWRRIGDTILLLLLSPFFLAWLAGAAITTGIVYLIYVTKEYPAHTKDTAEQTLKDLTRIFRMAIQFPDW